MKVPDGFSVIYQPKHKVPGVLDLHERGFFKTCPFVTSNWAYRIIADENLAVRLQFICLKEEAANDPETGERYNFHVEETQVDLDQALKLNPADLAPHVPSETVLEEVLESHDEWRTSYIPMNSKKKIDKAGLKKKLLFSIADSKETMRKALVRKNSTWVNPAMPRLVQDFMGGIYMQVEDRLFEQYKQMGGINDEKELINKIMLVQRVYDHGRQDSMRKPDGAAWKDEDEPWECWIGFAGSEEEAKRVCRTMEIVFRPLIKEMGLQATP
jgi:hypothetical protein